MDIDGIDFEEDAKNTGTDLSTITKLSERHIALEKQIAIIDNQRKALADELDKIARDLLPSAMDEASMASFTLNTGHQIEIKQIMTASYPTQSAIVKAKGEEDRNELLERRERCTVWIEENGGKPLLKTTIKADLDKTFGHDIDAILEKLHAEYGLQMSKEQTVHNGALVKFLKEKMADSQNIPFDDFKVFNGKVAKITQPKTK